MNIRDIRPGNLIRWVQTNEIVTVTGVFEDKTEVTARNADGTNVEDIIDAFEGVELSERVFINSGFEKTEISEVIKLMAYTKGNFRISNCLENKEYDVAHNGAFKSEACFQCRILHVHELQNLYYWLSNKEELEFTQPL